MKRRRSVTFGSSTEKVVESFKSLPQEMKDLIWLNDREINHFRNRARRICCELRRRRSSRTVRGLELRNDSERQKRKEMTIRFIVYAQKKYNPRMLAQVYRKSSSWSVISSAMVARKDFFDAYELAATCETTIPSMASYPLPFGPRSSKIRSTTTESCSSPDSVERRVRSRTSASV